MEEVKWKYKFKEKRTKFSIEKSLFMYVVHEYWLEEGIDLLWYLDSTGFI